MKKDRTRIVILLDRSGSMDSCRISTIRGFNKFLEEQKRIPGDVSLRFIQFDDPPTYLQHEGTPGYHVVYDGNLWSAPALTNSTFVPRGGTPLHDSQGRAIDELGKELAALSESERPEKVIFVTITDGFENASVNYTAEQVNSMVQHQTNKYFWDFVYIGANQDAIKVGSTIGVQFNKSMTYNASDPITVGATYSNLSSYVTRGRTASGVQALAMNKFSDEERSTSVDPNADPNTGTGNLAGTLNSTGNS